MINIDDLLNEIDKLEVETSENYPHNDVIDKDEAVRLIKQFLALNGGNYEKI